MHTLPGPAASDSLPPPDAVLPALASSESVTTAVEHVPAAAALQTPDVMAAVGSSVPGVLAWPFERLTSAPLGTYALLLGAMLLLASLDGIGAVFAKEWTLRQQPLLFLAGLLSFILLYVVFAHSLHIAELSIVSLGWIVFLQVGLLLVDVLRYGVSYSLTKWVAIAVIIGLQGYVMLTPNAK